MRNTVPRAMRAAYCAGRRFDRADLPRPAGGLAARLVDRVRDDQIDRVPDPAVRIDVDLGQAGGDFSVDISVRIRGR